MFCLLFVVCVPDLNMLSIFSLTGCLTFLTLSYVISGSQLPYRFCFECRIILTLCCNMRCCCSCNLCAYSKKVDVFLSGLHWLEKFVCRVHKFRDLNQMSWIKFPDNSTFQILCVASFPCVCRDESRERSRKKSPDRSRKSRREEKEEKETKRKKKSVSSEDEKPRRKRRQDSARWEFDV